VEKAVALQADVDEGRLHSGKHVVDDALVDVADDRSLAAPLNVELAHSEITECRLLRAASALGAITARTTALATVVATSCGAPCFEHRDASLARVD
jgi:hypothetical protein